MDIDERYTRHNEVVDVVLKAWSGERFDYEGEYFQYRDACVLPEPLQKPHPPVAVTVGSAEGARHVARAGFRLLTLGGVEKVREIVDEYAAELQRSGHDQQLIEDNLAQVGVLRHVYVGESDAEAQAVVRAPTEMLLRRLDALTTVAGEGSGEGIEEELENYLQTRFIAGSATGACEEVAALKEAGCGEVLCWFRWGAMGSEEARASMRRFSDQVACQFEG